MNWRDHRWDHKMLHCDADEDDNEDERNDENDESNESDNENDDKDDAEKSQNWSWWCWFWCWFWWCWFERRDFVLRRERFFSFYTAEWKMSLEKWWTKHENEFDWRLLNRIKWDVVDFRRFRLLHLLLTCATVFVSNFMRLFTYCAFCSDDEHLTNVFLMF